MHASVPRSCGGAAAVVSRCGASVLSEAHERARSARGSIRGAGSRARAACRAMLLGDLSGHGPEAGHGAQPPLEGSSLAKPASHAASRSAADRPPAGAIDELWPAPRTVSKKQLIQQREEVFDGCAHAEKHAVPRVSTSSSSLRAWQSALMALTILGLRQ
jgi:hypothetical protein